MKKFSLLDRFRSFKYAYNGMIMLLKNEHNTWIHMSLALCAIAGGFYFQINEMEWISIIICIGLVLTAEAFNTAIEKIADFVQPQKDEKIKVIKDLAAGGVLFTAISSFLVALIIFLPKFILVFSN